MLESCLIIDAFSVFTTSEDHTDVKYVDKNSSPAPQYAEEHPTFVRTFRTRLVYQISLLFLARFGLDTGKASPEVTIIHSRYRHMVGLLCSNTVGHVRVLFIIRSGRRYRMTPRRRRWRWQIRSQPMRNGSVFASGIVLDAPV